MKQPLQVTFRGMKPSPAVEADVRERAAKLEQFYEPIIGCRVIIETAHKHRHKGNLFNVRVNVRVPGSEIVVGRAHDLNHAHEDVFVASRDAFNVIRRKLEDYARKQRGKIKAHEVPPHGEITEITPMLDYGKITTPDGREIYFHRNSVVDSDFDKLEIGHRVRFVETMGEKGPQASTVHLEGKQHAIGE